MHNGSPCCRHWHDELMCNCECNNRISVKANAFTETALCFTCTDPDRQNSSRIKLSPSLRALVDLLHEGIEDTPRHFVDGALERHDLVVRILLVLDVQLRQLELRVQVLDRLLLGTLHLALAIELVEDRLLLSIGKLVVRVHEEPAALLVLNVGADLPDGLGGAEAIQVVILGLEVDAHDHQDVPARIVLLHIRDASNDHAQRDRGVE
mmetsp:Transcript_132482/g.424032  ORF Transcript_132482/g.424032 Transcript_132482/m.424032 type:complete len:208 (+) Transcript_132482:44-667(+)